MNDFDLLNIEEVAELFRVKVRTIRSWLDARKKGKSTFPLPFSEPGRKLFWRRGDVRNWNPRPEESIPEMPTEHNYRIALSEARCMDFPILAKIIQKRKKPK